MKTKVMQMTSAVLITLMLALALWTATAVRHADSIAGGKFPQPVQSDFKYEIADGKFPW